MRVAILGGGCAAITAAYELSRPEHGGRFVIDLYQEGWRLGGKGASGRGPAQRIEEHGLHLWMGYYENAFRLLRECYDALDRDPRDVPIAHWRDAFFPDPKVGLAEATAEGDWSSWIASFPAGEGLPGDPDRAAGPRRLGTYLVRTLELLRTLLESARSAVPEEADSRLGFGRSSPRSPPPTSDLRELLTLGQLATLGGLVEVARLCELSLRSLGRGPIERPVELLTHLAVGARKVFRRLIDADEHQRRIWTLVDLLLTIVRGALCDRLPGHPDGLDAIDDWDLIDWLRHHGAEESTLTSGFLRGLYSLTFAFEHGDPDRPRLAASVGLRGFFRMFFTYRGAVFWKMRASMGDVVFAPFYELLRQRGVRFHFFHRLEEVRIVPPRRGRRGFVRQLKLRRQAQILGTDYDPLIRVRGLPCWPGRPLTEQLVEGDRLEAIGWNPELEPTSPTDTLETLELEQDFDFVVLGVGLGVVPEVCRPLVQHDPRWSAMVRQLSTVGTQAFQLWLNREAKDLGWSHGRINLTAFAFPFDTWADMSPVLAGEDWRSPAPKSLAYFCGVLPESIARHPPSIARARTRQAAIDFLDHDLSHLWPRAVGAEGFDWSLLCDPQGAKVGGRPDASRFDSQFWTANVRPTDRYVQALPGSSRFRISPLDETYDNLTVAGDWTQCGLNFGCVEAAVISGRLAAHALSGRPFLHEIPGYDHP